MRALSIHNLNVHFQLPVSVTFGTTAVFGFQHTVTQVEISPGVLGPRGQPLRTAFVVRTLDTRHNTNDGMALRIACLGVAQDYKHPSTDRLQTPIPLLEKA